MLYVLSLYMTWIRWPRKIFSDTYSFICFILLMAYCIDYVPFLSIWPLVKKKVNVCVFVCAGAHTHMYACMA
jgi:hypothetical protein